MGLGVSDKPSVRSGGKLGLRLIEKLLIPIDPSHYPLEIARDLLFP